MPSSLLLRPSLTTDLARLRSDLLADAVVLRFRRFVDLAVKFNPGQPRIPAGRPGGGRWTDGSDALLDASTGDWSEVPVVLVSAQRVRGRYTVRIGNRDVEVSGPQAVRFEALRGQAEAAVRAVREIDPRRRGPASWTTGEIEGEILHQEARLLAANRRLMELGDPQVRSEPFRQCLMRDGEWMAWREGRANSDVVTVRREEFPEVVSRFMRGARGVKGPATYDGAYFLRGDGTAFGLRASQFNNTTIDLYEFDGTTYVPVGKVHQK